MKFFFFFLFHLIYAEVVFFSNIVLKPDQYILTPEFTSMGGGFNFSLAFDPQAKGQLINLYFIKGIPFGLCCDDNTNQAAICLENKKMNINDIILYNETFEIDEIGIISGESKEGIKEGVISPVIMRCGGKKDEISITGYISMYGKDQNFLSYEQKYVIIIRYVCLASVIVFWSVFIMKKFKMKIYSNISFKLIFAIIPLMLIRNLLKVLNIHSIITIGVTNMIYVVIYSLSNVAVEAIIRIVFFLVSIGYTLNLQLRLYKEQKSIYTIPKNKVVLFSILLSLYSLSCFFYDIFIMEYKFYFIDMGYKILFNSLSYSLNFMIWYGIFMRIKKKSETQMNNVLKIKKYFLRYNRVIALYLVLYLITIVVTIICKILKGKYALVYVKWIEDSLIEITHLVLTFGCALLVLNGPKQNKDGYICELQESNKAVFDETKSSLTDI